MTSRLLSALAAAAVVAAAVSGPMLEGRQTSDYVVSDYALTIDLASGGSTARVTMDLTYRIERGTKSDGFKYIAKLEPTDISGEEVDGPPMRMTVEHQRETLIRWRFTPAGPGEKRVRVRFSVPSGVWGTATESTFDAPWAGIFKVPVRRAVYRLLTPGDWNERSLAVRPSSFTKAVVDGRTAIEVRQAPLQDAAFSVTLRPGLTTAAPAPVEATTTTAAPQSRGGAGVAAIAPILGLVAIAALILFIVANAKRGRRSQTNADGSTSSVSSCAGGSSCSSSCGGGGCGGGCGG